MSDLGYFNEAFDDATAATAARRRRNVLGPANGKRGKTGNMEADAIFTLRDGCDFFNLASFLAVHING